LGSIIAAACGSIVQPVSADMISYTSTPFSGDTSLDASLQQFDPTLGTLTGATVTLNADLTPVVEVLNYTGSSAPFTYAFETTYDTNPVTNQVVFTPSPATVTDPYSNVQDVDFVSLVQNGVAADQGINQFDGTPVLFSLDSTVPVGDLSSFVGSSDVSFDYAADGDGNYGGSGAGLYFGGDRSYAGTATVTYTYDAVPEPTSLGLLGLGALGLFRRRRCAK